LHLMLVIAKNPMSNGDCVLFDLVQRV